MQPELSVIVICYNMRREAARTLYSLSTRYQTGLEPHQYEVIAIDNGSSAPLDPDSVTGLGANFHYVFHDTSSVSPVDAVMLGASLARGRLIAVIVDGARMASPGLLRYSLQATRLADDPFVTSLAFHLGPDVQNVSMLNGYDQAVEDELLRSISWPENGYDLFNIATIAQSSGQKYFGGMPTESSWFTMRRDTFQAAGGFDRRFRAPGGGVVNHEFLLRVLTLPSITPVLLLGEGVFHQFHGGVATNVPLEQHPSSKFKAEFERIFGYPLKPVKIRTPLVFGTLPDQLRPYMR